MTEDKTQDDIREVDNAAPESALDNPDPENSVNKRAVLVVLAIVLSLVAYLLADRFTPVTSQARVEGYVIGVAPEVSGRVVDVWVRNNQEVMAGDPLFQLDRSQFEIALQRARTDLESAERQMGAGSAAVDAARANLLAA